jgi:tetratricopeptide (TPR) repeat protein
MAELPFDIPHSLMSYLEQYESAPVKISHRLEKQLKKRGPDAVGHFLLGWFYHRQDNHQKAMTCAVKAKSFAPGSPFFEKLHYYFSHPELFEAWCSESRDELTHINRSGGYTSQSIHDLNVLIEKLSALEPSPMKENMQSLADDDNPEKNSFDDTDDIVSETLAKIHENQGKKAAAIKTYNRLKEINSGQADFYDEQIKRLEAGRDNHSEEE